ncbi:hypothetical protein L226DRAFT_544245 [Lentinus tigrinus ALCF2SS1-7]|uniref:RGS domain-containing protein n=1 Tax=Lentinus tigrinus ALCF2SS1-6 TaxID=1328759 RepID=A0A5C2SFB5_9APHY|nr:hypothetical protein L227DRAFT_498748 [Lentinus tigrinus ALCF2SS1-6]RPD77781.1 hypothetical protein L226DRAFT_544245 [Lentinus tigrinus ALCF2SS1-7]
MSSRLHQSSSSRSSPPAPKTIKLRAHALLSLPYRLTHPPPQPKASSVWGITPHFHIPLDEILDRKHLPPLGLKDFEEWLLFIDRMPECLYFVLWLREYKTRYTAWRRQSKPSSPIRCSSNPDARTYRAQSAPPPPNPPLTQFYLRAKETFLTPYAPYALPVPLDLLAPFYSSMDAPGYRPPDHLLGVPGHMIPPPPYPEVFEEVEERIIAILSDSLDRFVLATFHNVGMPRAYCGCAGGTVIGLTASAPILLANFLTGGSRWWRFSALPGLWLGLTIVISAMYGVCMMIYVFGDLRQLRSFELARVPGTDQTTQSSMNEKQETTGRRATTLKFFARSSSAEQATMLGRIQPLIGPPLMQQSPSGDFTVVPRSPSEAACSVPPRLTPPKLHIVPPTPAHTARHIHTSARAHYQYSPQTQVQSVSSASTTCSVKFHHPNFFDPRRTAYDTEDDCTVSGSEYESDYDNESDSDVSSEGSHISGMHEGAATNARLTAPHARTRRRHRRRRGEPEIHISDAIYDEDPSPEGPAMGEGERRRSSTWGGSTEEDVGMGATFIHPFQWDDADESLCTHDVESQAYCAAEHQRIDAFDFDGLPPRPLRHHHSDSTAASLPSPTIPTFASNPTLPHASPVDPEKLRRGVHFASDVEKHAGAMRPLGHREAPRGPVGKFLGTLQQKCGPRNVAMYLLGGVQGSASTLDAPESTVVGDATPEVRTSSSIGPISPTSTLSPPSVVWPSEKTSSVQSKMSWRKRVRQMLQVPAFASPLTPVLNPIVTRGQWEIVVRSALIALALSAAVVGGLVAAPETRVV